MRKDFMTRSNAKQKLIDLGVAEPTEEQITTLIESVKAETNPLIDQANKAAGLQKQLEDLQNQNLSDSEKLQKQVEALTAQNKDLMSNSFRSEGKAILKGANLADEDIETILSGVVAGAEKLEDVQTRANAYVALIKKSSESAVKEHNKELLDNTHVPDGTTPPPAEKTAAEKTAESLGKELSGSNKASTDILSAYSK